MSTPSSSYWKLFFTKWPAGFPQKGMVGTILNEQIPFKAFMVSGDMLLLERTNPDASGVRFILMHFDDIASVRFVDPLREADCVKAGFQGKLAIR